MNLKKILGEAALWTAAAFLMLMAFLEKPATWLLKATATTFVGLLVLSILGAVHL